MPFIVILVILIVVISKAKKAAEAEKKSSSAAKAPMTPTAVHASHTSYRAANTSYNDSETYRANRYHSDRPVTNGRQFADQTFDSKHYHSEGYDFSTCVSFGHLPEGTDELKYLEAINARHEKDLEKLLTVSEQQV